MAEFLVHIDTESFQARGERPVIGKIWVELDGHAFPEQGWWDFPIVILGWWMRAAAELNGRHQRAEFVIMDGPYRVEPALDGSEVKALAYRDTLQGRVPVVRFTLALRSLQTELLAAARASLAWCEAHGVVATDVAALRQGGATLAVVFS